MFPEDDVIRVRRAPVVPIPVGLVEIVVRDCARRDHHVHETELNEATPGDPRDTTTPLAMIEMLRKTVLGSLLSASSREQLIGWFVANKTGDKRLRAGIPRG